MAFEKKWTDEQNNEILKLKKSGLSNEKIAKKFNSTESTIKSRIGYLNHKAKKKLKKVVTKKTPKVKSKKIKEDIELSTAEIKNESEDMADLYRGKDINLDETKKLSLGAGIYVDKDPEPLKAEIEEPQEEPEVDWSGVPEQFVEMINNRFISFNKKEGKEVLKVMTNDQKQQGAQATLRVLNKRGKVFMEYSDLIGLGAFIFGAILPNVMIAFSYAKQNKAGFKSEGIEIHDLTKTKEPEKKEPTANDLDKAQRAYERALQEGQ